MFVLPAIVRCLIAVSLAALLAGCYPHAPGTPEDNHPLISEAVARKSGSPREAARLLERALEANPRLARAHWELALICLNQTADYAAAVYHFQKVLALRPDWPHATTTRQLISNAKLELVKEGVEAPNLPSVQRQMDRLVAELHQLTALKTNLQGQVQYLSGITQQLAAENLQLRQYVSALHHPTTVEPGLADASAQPNPLVTSPPPLRSARSPAPPAPNSATRPQPALSPFPGPSASGTVFGQRPLAQSPGRVRPTVGGRSHTVQRGETAFAISRRYGVTVNDLVAANPGLNPSQLKAGQTLQVPVR